MRFCLKFCLIFYSSFVFANWVPVLKNQVGDTLFYDPSQIVQVGDDRHVRMYSNFVEARPADTYESKSSMMHLSINCKRRTFSVLQIVDFDDENLSGTKRPKTFSYPKISKIPDKSSIHEIEKRICD
jgi:predicted nucleotidyltransferase